MATDITVYYNPDCSKSRRVAELLQSGGYAPRLVNYLQSPLSESALRALIGLLRVPIRDLIRTNEPAYAEAGLREDASSEAILRAIAARPVLMQRPIAVAQGKAVIARPPERVWDILARGAKPIT